MGLIIAYAQPTSEEPYLSLKDIKKGRVKKTKKSFLSSVLSLTDVGLAIWQTAKKIDPKVKIKFNKIPFFQRETTDPEQYQWDLEIIVEDFILMLKSRRYIPIKEDPSAFYLTLELRGDDDATAAFLKQMVQTLGRNPAEFTDIEKLAKKIEVDQSMIIKTWVEFADVQMAATVSDGVEAGIMAKVDQAMETLQGFCENETVHQKIAAAVEKQVKGMLGKGKVRAAKKNAVTIIKKIRAMKQKFDTTMKTLDKLHEKIRLLEDEGKDILPPLNAMIAAENALKQNDYRTLKSKFEESKKMVAQLLKELKSGADAGAAAAPAAQAAQAPQPPPKLMSFDLAASGSADDEDESRPDVEEIASFVECKVCGEVLGEKPVWQCPECGKRYHTSCASSLEKCLVCLSIFAEPPGDTADTDADSDTDTDTDTETDTEVDETEPIPETEPVTEDEDDEIPELDEVDMEGILAEEIEISTEPTSINDEFDAFLKEIDEL